MKKVLSIVAVMILCAATFAGCTASTSRVEKVISRDGDNYILAIHRCEDDCGDCHKHIKEIEVETKSNNYVIKIKYDDSHTELIKAPVTNTYIYYAYEEDK